MNVWLPPRDVHVRIPPARFATWHDNVCMETEGFMKTETFQLERFATPTGRMLLVSDEQGRVHALDWQDHDERMQRLLGRYYRNVALSLRDASQESAAKRAL